MSHISLSKDRALFRQGIDVRCHDIRFDFKVPGIETNIRIPEIIAQNEHNVWTRTFVRCLVDIW